MRLQLRSLLGAAVVAAATVLPAAPARATQDASARVTVFKEPSRDNEGVTVTHPQLDVGTTLGPEFHLGVGYEVDIVSGATPKVFQPRPGPLNVDAVSSATKFSDVRHQFHGALSYDRPTSSVSLGGSYGFESDYKSLAVTGGTRSDLLDHNFTVALSYTHNFDEVCDANNAGLGDQPLKLKALTSSSHCFTSQTDVATHRVHIDTFQPSISWTTTPKLLLQLGSTVQILDGFQSNPYRSVALGQENNIPQERLPQFRERYAVYLRALYAVPAARGSMHGMVRGYSDSWAVQSVTGEVLLNKYFGNALLLTLRGRYHLQSGASFYRDAVGYRNLGPNGQYWTGDRELSPMSNYLTGAKLALFKRPEQERSSWYVDMELDLKYELLIYHLESADAPNADRKNAHIIQAAFSLRF
ncbi:MAG TPA: DUF3570 domain-containing protein [Polyangia bacterium]|nr:DUF3570 domain-containing protein [Polyangia bacterium]